MLRAKEAPTSGLRRWLSELRVGWAASEMLLSRVESIAREKGGFDAAKFDQAIAWLGNGLSLKRPVFGDRTPIFDILSLLSLQGERR
jgi:hypothetical protein